MSAEDDSSDLSSLSSLSPAPSDIELEEPAEEPIAKPKKGIQKYFSKVTEQPPKEDSPPPRKRSPSPPHEYVLADNPDIAVSALRCGVSFSMVYIKQFGAWICFCDAPSSRVERHGQMLTAIVHCNVQKPLQRRISEITSPLWSPRTRARCRRTHTWRSSRTLPLRVAGVTIESQTRCQVRQNPDQQGIRC